MISIPLLMALNGAGDTRGMREKLCQQWARNRCNPEHPDYDPSRDYDLCLQNETENNRKDWRNMNPRQRYYACVASKDWEGAKRYAWAATLSEFDT